MARFGFGDIAVIKEENVVVRIECEIIDEDGTTYYEVSPRDFNVPGRYKTRIIREDKLEEYHG